MKLGKQLQWEQEQDRPPEFQIVLQRGQRLAVESLQRQCDSGGESFFRECQFSEAGRWLSRRLFYANERRRHEALERCA